ncbi:uncharacterized protein LOC123510868 isoform X2 [Portunus trituberculatus]|nr:uncharacterized protein LOC123510868 isoform X2 [Portunus trituberculatus]
MASSIPPVDYLRLKLFCILEGPGAATLKFILKRGTKVPNPPVSFLNYLNSLKSENSTANFCKLTNRKKKDVFNKTEMDQINADHLWENFDLTFLFKAIRYGCENVEGFDHHAWNDHTKLEGMVKEIKDERNTVVHERRQLTDHEFQGKMTHLKDLFLKALDATEHKFGASIQDITQEKRRIDDVIHDILSCFTIEGILRLDTLRHLPVFKNMFFTRLRDIYKKSQIFDPLCFLSRVSKKDLNIQDIFTKIIIKKEPGDKEIDYLDILVYTQSLGLQQQVTSSTQQQQPIHVIQQPQSTMCTQQPQPNVSTQHPQPTLSTQHPQPTVSTQQPQPPLPIQHPQPPLPIQQSQSITFTQQPTASTQQPHPTVSTQQPQPTLSTQQPQSTHTTFQTDLVHPQLLLIKGVAGSGKTTLLTFIVSEWIKHECERRMKHLDVYDFVLHVLCRDGNYESLEEFLEQVFPEASSFKPYTMTLITKFKILFLIDGLDERNSSSRKLVNDILKRSEMLPGCTIICTSRPETVVDFLQSVSNKYKKSQGIMMGISQNDRTKFVTRYYMSLSVTGSPNCDKLAQVMERVGWRDHFGLPLNLLFLSTLFRDKPECVRENTTQTSLYLAMHDWSLEKLQYRLAEHPQTRDFNRLYREESIEIVLDLIYQVSFECLMENRQFLSRDDMKQLKHCCKDQELPREEMLGSFFSLRETVTTRVSQVYHSPHKGIQEFFAAKHIVRILNQSSDESVRRLLRQPTKETIQTLKNLLLHVAGLLSQKGVQSHPRAIKEVVDLLKESGMDSCRDWLVLLEDTEVNAIALKCVAEHIERDNDVEEELIITDNTISSAMALLPIIPRKTLYIHNEKRDLDVHKLVQDCADHTISEMLHWHHYEHPILHITSDSSLRVLPKTRLRSFMGHLSDEGIRLLQDFKELQILYLTVSDEKDAQRLLSILPDACSSLPTLSCLGLHIPVPAVASNALTTPLPDVTDDDNDHTVILVLSGVDETLRERAWRIAKALKPPSGE